MINWIDNSSLAPSELSRASRKRATRQMAAECRRRRRTVRGAGLIECDRRQQNGAANLDRARERARSRRTTFDSFNNANRRRDEHLSRNLPRPRPA